MFLDLHNDIIYQLSRDDGGGGGVLLHSRNMPDRTAFVQTGHIILLRELYNKRSVICLLDVHLVTTTTKYWPFAGQRRRRWTNNRPFQRQCVVFARYV